MAILAGPSAGSRRGGTGYRRRVAERSRRIDRYRARLPVPTRRAEWHLRRNRRGKAAQPDRRRYIAAIAADRGGRRVRIGRRTGAARLGNLTHPAVQRPATARSEELERRHFYGGATGRVRG